MRHIHLDPLGGIAGDMFIAALLDALPQFAAGAIEAAQALAPVRCALLPHKDRVLTGKRFAVREAEDRFHHHHGDHSHVHWSSIRRAIAGSSLSAAVQTRAIDIFSSLAQAEAKIHGVAEDDVAFHEVGAADSIADIVGAAWLIDAIGPASWSTSPLPLGGGLIETAHGRLPVPAPATALLLEGMQMTDDGVPGERVTPTGAAILRHLQCGGRRGGVRLAASGTGFGTRVLPRLSNCLRVLVFEADEQLHAAPAAPHRTLLVVTFEVDDQSPEDLANGLDRLRAMPEVHDVLTMAACGKKGRLATHVQVLAAPEHEDAVIDACFAQTTTIGLRTQHVAARALQRELASVMVDGSKIRLKAVQRPGGVTVKAESDDIAAGSTHAARARLRRLAEESES